MIAAEVASRCREFDVFILDELGLSLLWDVGVGQIVEQGEDALGPATLSDAARQRLLEWATEEQNEGSPRVNMRLSVALWSGLEAFVEDLFVLRLAGNHEFLTDPRLERVRVPLAEYRRLDEEAQLRLLAGRAEGVQGRSAPASLEALLDIVGLSGDIHEAAARSLRELEQVRNVFMHRNGVADRRVVDARYRLNISEGDPIKVDGAHFLRYYRAVDAYSDTIWERLSAEDEGRAPGPPVEPVELEVRTELEDLGDDAGE